MKINQLHLERLEDGARALEQFPLGRRECMRRPEVVIIFCEENLQDGFEVEDGLHVDLFALFLQLLVSNTGRLVGHLCKLLSFCQQPLHSWNRIKAILYHQSQRMIITKVLLEVVGLSDYLLHVGGVIVHAELEHLRVRQLKLLQHGVQLQGNRGS